MQERIIASFVHVQVLVRRSHLWTNFSIETVAAVFEPSTFEQKLDATAYVAR